MRILGLSAATITGLFLLATAIVGLMSAVTVALIGRESKKQNEQATTTVSEFEKAWTERGHLIKGYEEDQKVMLKRMDVLEQRAERAEKGEQRCLEGYEHAMQRLAVLEERLGVKDDGHTSADD